MKVLVSKKSGYKWTIKDNIFIKGKIFSKKTNKVLNNDDLFDILSILKTSNDFATFLQEIDGVYSIIIKKKEIILAAVDVSRSMPIYFSSLNGGVVSDSAEQIRKEVGIGKERVSEFNYTQLLACDYIFGHNTVYEDIKQLDLGEYLVLSEEGFSTSRYFYHISEVTVRPKEVLLKELKDTAERVFLRLKNEINGRPVVLSMSGGYDSRFVGCMMKKVGITDISCYTYGKIGSFEVEQSRKNAEALGFRWRCVDYTDEEMRRAFDETGQEYLLSYDGHDFTAYMQNFPAVRKIHEDGWVKPNSVFVTGLCGDMPTGEYVVSVRKYEAYDIETAANHLYGLLYARYAMKDQYKKEWIAKMINQLKSLPIDIKDYQSWQTAVDAIYTSTCHSHWFMHMNSVHSFFGYEWLMPLWDSEWLKLWYSISAVERQEQKLYEDFLMEDICKMYGLNTKKHIAKYSKSKIVAQMMRNVGTIIMYIVLHLGIPFRRKYDYNNFAPLELLVYQSLPTRSTVKYKRAGIMHLMNQYVLQKRYGVENMKKHCKMIVK